MQFETIRYTGHAVRRMYERRISREDVLTALTSGRTIAAYPDDTPYPSRLILAYVNDRPLHVVAAYDEQTKTCLIVSVYEPDRDLWESDYSTRKQK